MLTLGLRFRESVLITLERYTIGQCVKSVVSKTKCKLNQMSNTKGGVKNIL